MIEPNSALVVRSAWEDIESDRFAPEVDPMLSVSLDPSLMSYRVIQVQLEVSITCRSLYPFPWLS